MIWARGPQFFWKTMNTEPLTTTLLQAISEVRATVDTNALIAALERNDHAAALALLGITGHRFPALEAVLGNHFAELLTAAYERSAHSSRATSLEPEQIAASQTLRRSITSEVTASIAQGTTTALDAVMRLNAPAETKALTLTQALGLSERQARSLVEFANCLTTTLRTGNAVKIQTAPRAGLMPSQTRFLNASQRSTVQKALRDRLTPDDAKRLIERQAATLAKHRAQTTAEFQLARTQEQAKHDTIKRLQDAGTVRRYWTDAGDERVRANHKAVSTLNPAGVSVDQPFKTAFGPVMIPPLEPGCRCRVVYERADGSRP